jgi:hypothetical protein
MNVGIVTGSISNLVVLDVDGADGEKTLSHYGEPDTLSVITGKGRQFYFTHPGFKVHNFCKKKPGLDLRGDGGYAVAPPSVHPSGKVYTWAGKETLAPLPAWILELVRPDDTPPPTVKLSDNYVNAALHNEIGQLQSAQKGNRNNALNTAAFKLGRLVQAGALCRHTTEMILVAVGISLGLPEREVVATVRSGLNAQR